MAEAATAEKPKGKTKGEKLIPFEVIRDMKPEAVKAEWIKAIDAAITKKDGSKNPTFMLQVQREELILANSVMLGHQDVRQVTKSLRASPRMVEVMSTFRDAITQPSGVRDNGRPKLDWENINHGRDGVNHLYDKFGRDTVKNSPSEAYHPRALHFSPEKMIEVVKGLKEPLAVAKGFDNFQQTLELSGTRRTIEARRIMDAQRARQAKSKEGAEMGA